MSIKAYGQSSWRGRTVTVATMEEFLAENGYVSNFSATRLRHEILSLRPTEGGTGKAKNRYPAPY